MKSVKVKYNIMTPLVCEEHHEYGPIMCCPFPGCPNGTKADSIEFQYPGISKVNIDTRVRWTDADGQPTYSWQGDLPLLMQVSRILWREASRRNLLGRRSESGHPIYHYTSPEGLLGIVENNEFRLSDYSYLNDTEELTYGFGLAQRRFAIAAKARPPASAMLRRWSRVRESLGARVCIGSFSFADDSLSQWRAYGPLAIGFNAGPTMFGYNNSTQIKSVIYDASVQERLLDLMAHLWASAYEHDKQMLSPKKLSAMYSDGIDSMLEVVAFLKHPAFEDEREVRLVHVENPRIWGRLGVTASPRRFRVSGGVIRPYVTTRDLTEAHLSYPDKMPIREVVIGPSPNADVLERGIRDLLSARGYDSVDVRRSVAPLR